MENKNSKGFIEILREKLGYNKKGRFSAQAMKRRAEKMRKKKKQENNWEYSGGKG